MMSLSAATLPFGKYQTGRSLLHRLDPRTKLFNLMWLLIALVWITKWRQLVLLGLPILAGVGCSGSSRKTIWRDVLSLKLFYVITILGHIIFPRSTLDNADWQFTLNTADLIQGVFFAVKIALIGLLAGALNRTTHPSQWGEALETLIPSHTHFARRLGRPALVFGLALRALPTLLMEAERIRMAQIGRGLCIEGGLFRRARNLQPLLTPLLSSAFHYGGQTTAAMLSRGYNPDQPRTSLYPLKMARMDWVVSALTFLLSLWCILPS
ncbi:MAG: energy-coupling factor transporter transmembrane protein EcfT [Calditrichaeota bacterium]|nr:energy-coupling factor transporter transmembrane protein EcfT [Calditrichota bacterium]